MQYFAKKGKTLLLLSIILSLMMGTVLSSLAKGEKQNIINILQQNIIEVSKKVSSAVVNIRTIQLPSEFFFSIVPREGQGSGVIFDKGGYILTNEHVIHNAAEIKVVLTDGREFDGKLVGSDPMSDLAVVKIDGQNLPVAKLGDSSKLKPGQFCIAIGNPFGLQNTVTFGVISALGRDIKAQPGKILEDLIQTDAPINPGNSGGPLINLEGEVIGINTAIIPYAQGIGFAIPINKAKEIIGDLIKYGRVIRPWLGIYYLPVTAQIKRRFGLSAEAGIYIVEVIPGSPADKGGIRKGDVIVRADGMDVKTSDDLREVIGKKKVGDRMSILIMRGDKIKGIEVELGEMPRG